MVVEQENAGATASVIVSNIDSSLTESQVREFFAFCGKVQSLKLEADPDDDSLKVATIEFERRAAVDTALLLQDAQLGPRKISIKPGKPGAAGSAPQADSDSGNIRQEDKPRSAIFAEILSQGFVLSDKTIQTGLDLDRKTGISVKIKGFLNEAQEKGKELDGKYHVSDKLNPLFATASRHFQGMSATMSNLFTEARNSTAGSRLYDFYNNTSKQVNEVREEARRLADERQGISSGGVEETSATNAAAAAPAEKQTAQ